MTDTNKLYLESIDNSCYEFISNMFRTDKDKLTEFLYWPILNPTHILVIKPSLYYLFDGYLSEDIGSSDNVTMQNLEKLEIHELTKINHRNLINIPNLTHATRFYKIDCDTNQKYYLIYSNSGLGIDNHIQKSNSVYPKIFVSNNKNHRDLLVDIVFCILF